MIVGRRTNVRWDAKDVIYLPINVTRVAWQRGALYSKGADYFFIANNAFPWNRVPDFVIARDGYDNFLVASAIRNNVSVIDATATILAVHQTDLEGNLAGAKVGKDTRFNKQLIGKFRYFKGHTKSAPYETALVNSRSDNIMTVVVKKRLLERKRRIRKLSHHGLSSNASPALRATRFPSGKGQILTTYTESITRKRAPKIDHMRLGPQHLHQ